MISRRKFLKWLGIGSAAAMVPVGVAQTGLAHLEGEIVYGITPVIRFVKAFRDPRTWRRAVCYSAVLPDGTLLDYAEQIPDDVELTRDGWGPSRLRAQQALARYMAKRAPDHE